MYIFPRDINDSTKNIFELVPLFEHNIFPLRFKIFLANYKTFFVNWTSRPCVFIKSFNFINSGLENPSIKQKTGFGHPNFISLKNFCLELIQVKSGTRTHLEREKLFFEKNCNLKMGDTIPKLDTLTIKKCSSMGTKISCMYTY